MLHVHFVLSVNEMAHSDIGFSLISSIKSRPLRDEAPLQHAQYRTESGRDVRLSNSGAFQVFVFLARALAVFVIVWISVLRWGRLGYVWGCRIHYSPIPWSRATPFATLWNTCADSVAYVWRNGVSWSLRCSLRFWLVVGHRNSVWSSAEEIVWR